MYASLHTQLAYLVSVYLGRKFVLNFLPQYVCFAYHFGNIIGLLAIMILKARYNALCNMLYTAP